MTLYRLGSAVILTGLVFAACPSHTSLSLKDQEAIRNDHQGEVFHLKHANFVGPFFEYDDRLLISERAFDERVLIESPGGDPILPAEPTGVLRMGTRVRILEISFPTSGAIASRKLRSPRHFAWVLLESVDKDAEPKDSAKPYVLVLTQELRSRKEFSQALSVYLVDKDPRQAFAGRPPEVLTAIDRKILLKKMRYDEVIRSRGHPDKVTRQVIDGVRVERWEYAPNRVVVMKDDRVDSWTGFPTLPTQEGGSS